MKKMLMIVFIAILTLSGCWNDEKVFEKDDSQIIQEEKVEDPVTQFSEEVLIDNEFAKITITKIEGNPKKGYSLKALIENKTEDRNLMYSVISASVDGVAIDPLFASDVAALKKANEEISFRASRFEDDVDITWSDIMMHIRITDADNWSEEAFVDDYYHIYPLGQDKATKYIRSDKEGDIILCDNEYLKALVYEIDEENTFGYTLKLYVENKTDSEMMVSVDDASINGFMIDPFFSMTVLSNAVEFNEVSWSNSKLEENNIEQVENIEFSFKAYDFNNWFSSPYYEDIVHLDILDKE